MKKRLLIVLLFVILGLVVLASGCTQQNQNATPNNTFQNSTVQNATHNNTVQENKVDISGARYNDIVITQKGPSTPQKRGTSVPISYTITNNGKNRVYNVLVWSQDFGKNVGTLNPGQTKKYTYLEYIPTDNDLASWHDSSVKLTSPLEIGSIYLSFKDDKGVSHRIQSNSIAIKFK